VGGVGATIPRVHTKGRYVPQSLDCRNRAVLLFTSTLPGKRSPTDSDMQFSACERGSPTPQAGVPMGLSSDHCMFPAAFRYRPSQKVFHTTPDM
jgi:hypothetical protein